MIKARITFTLAMALITSLVLGQAKPPIMGWSSWNNFRIHIDENMIREQADALVSSGLYDAGYRFINIDDGYFGGRDANGNLVANHKFPSGMKALADYIHAKGLKAGIYSDAGRNTCGSIYDNDSLGVGVGMYGHIEQDCQTLFNQWGFDFLKVDWCGGERQGLDEQSQYTKIIQTVRSINPDIVFNVCRWKFPGEWVTKLADSWRISGDITAQFSSILKIIDQNAELYQYASAGHYNDMDMLQVGRGMSFDEDKSHFSMWCMMNSPLLAGNDLRNMSEETISILTNKELIALNQDLGFKQAQRLIKSDSIEVWVKPLGNSGKARAVAILNRSERPVSYDLPLASTGARPNAKWRDLWAHQDLGRLGRTATFQIPGHGVVVIRTQR